MAAIGLRGIEKFFGRTRVLAGIDLDVADRELVVVVGPSGCGKSTLLRLVAGLEDPSAGEIRFDGEVVNDLPPARRGIAMVFQSYALYPHMSVFDNMAFGLKIARRGKAAIAERVMAAARILQIEELLGRRPRELSGGQRQRVAIGRAIVRDPRVFLFDEPLSNLDAALRVQMRIEIARLHRALHATMVYVTHDQVEAMTLAERIVVLDAGRVEQVGTPLELYHRPKNRFVASFIGSPRMNFIDARVVEAGEGGIDLDLGAGARARLPEATGMEPRPRPGRRLVLGVRPEHLALGGEGALRLGGEVVAVERLGAETFVHLAREGGEPLVVRADGGAEVTVGERLLASAPASACHLFDEGGEALARPPGVA